MQLASVISIHTYVIACIGSSEIWDKYHKFYTRNGKKFTQDEAKGNFLFPIQQ